VLAARKPSLRGAAGGEGRRAQPRDPRRHADRDRPQRHPRPHRGVDLWWSGRHRHHGGNIQADSAPNGWPLWTSDVRPGREHDVGDVELAQHQPEVLDRPGASGVAVADESCGCAIPRTGSRWRFQRAGGGVVVLRGDEDEAVERRNGRGPGVRVRPAVHPERRRERLVEVWQAKSAMSPSSYCASSRWAAMPCTQRATASPLRPGRVLPRIIAILVMVFSARRAPVTAVPAPRRGPAGAPARPSRLPLGGSPAPAGRPRCGRARRCPRGLLR
jgi:hypothetical protein